MKSSFGKPEKASGSLSTPSAVSLQEDEQNNQSPDNDWDLIED